MHPLCLRHGSSDFDVFDQIFFQKEYEPLYALCDARLIIDGGANVGYSSACLLSRFPNSHIVAVEPDPENFAMLGRNLQAYGSRVTLVRAGVWSHSAPLVMSQDPYRDGREWARQVRPCAPDEKPDFEGIDIASLLVSSGYERISLLKMDIEGAEAIVFRENIDWLEKVDAIAIELHDDSSFGNGSEVFFSAIRGQEFEVSRCGELTICWRPGRMPAAGLAPATSR